MKQIAILGSTGSIGSQTLTVLQQFPTDFQVMGLAAGGNITVLARQIQIFKPQVVAVASSEKATALTALLKNHGVEHLPQILMGPEGLCQVATLPQVETVVIGLVGFIGLLPTLKALKSGKQVLTANKETFVTAGHLVKPYLRQIVPLDSEHSAIFQCLQGSQAPEKEVHKIYLTASGGPFRELPLEQLHHVTVEQALNHPNWSMGDKITIDSATMMNKGLEIIEAHHLFQLPLEKIEVVVHPQSIVHSAVAYVDGATIAQLGEPDMRVPIQYGLTYPKRCPTAFSELHLDLTTLGTLQFYPADETRFPCLRLARWAAETGGTLPVVLNAADELAVEAFLKGNIGFMEIPKRIEWVMKLHMPHWADQPTLETIIAVDTWTRQTFTEMSDLKAPSL